MTRAVLTSLLLAAVVAGCGDDGSHQDSPDARTGAPDAGTPDAHVIDGSLAPSLSVAPQALNLIEGAEAGLAVSLAGATDLAVNITVDPPGVVSLGSSVLVFGRSGAQTITVTAQPDADTDDDHAIISLSAAGVAPVQVPVTVTEDHRRPVSLVVSPAVVTVAEGTTGQLRVRLSALPRSPVTVAVRAAGVEIAPASLSFTTSSWDVEQTINIVAPQDADAVDAVATVELSHTVTGTTTVPVTISDDDVQRIVLSRVTASVREGDATTVEVSLAAQPTADVVVTVSSASIDDVTVAPSTLTFTPSNYAVRQRVTLQSLRDSDAAADRVAVRFSGAGLATETVDVHVNEVDVIAITAPQTVTVDEGSDGEFGVALTSAPSAPVTVRVESSVPSLLTVEPATLTFTRSNWNVAQPVTASAAIDANITSDAVGVLLRASGLATTIVNVAITDRHAVRLALTPEALTLSEGDRATFTVALRDRPVGNVVLQVGSTDTTAALVTPAAVAFTPANYDRPQTITVISVPDADAVNDATSVTFTLDGQVQASVPVSISDTLVRAIVTSAPSLTITEGERSTVGVSLSAPPTSSALVTVTSPSLAVLQATPRLLSFNRANWNVPQQVTILAVRDADVSDSTVAMQLSADDYPPAVVEVTIDDIDVQEIRTATRPVRLIEGQSIDIPFLLRRPFTSASIVTASTDDPTIATVTPAATIVDPARWSEVHHVTITGVRDDNQTNDRTSLRLRLDGAADVVVEIEVVDLRD